MNLWSHLLTQQYINNITSADYNLLCDILTDGFETDVVAEPDGDAIKLSRWLCLLNHQQIRIGTQTMRISEMLADNRYKTDTPLAAKGKVFLVGMGFSKIASDATSMIIATKRGHQFSLRKAAKGLVEMQIGSAKRTLFHESTKTTTQFMGFVSDGNALYFTQQSRQGLPVAYFWDDGNAFKCSVGSSSEESGTASGYDLEEIRYDGATKKRLSASLQSINFKGYTTVYIRMAYHAGGKYRAFPGMYMPRFAGNFQQCQSGKIIEFLEKASFSTDDADWEETDYEKDDFVIGYQGGYRLTRYAMLLGNVNSNAINLSISSRENGKPINAGKIMYHSTSICYISKMRIKNLKSTDDTIFGTLCPPNTWVEFAPDLSTGSYQYPNVEYDYIDAKPIPKRDLSKLPIFDLRKKMRWYQAIYHKEPDGISYASGNITVEGTPINNNTIIVRHPDGDLRYDNQPSKYTIAMPSKYLNCQIDAFAPYSYCGIIKHHVVPYSNDIALRDNTTPGTALAFDQIEGQCQRYGYGFSMDAGTIKIPKQSKPFAAICYHDSGVSVVMLSDTKKVDTDAVRLKANGSKIELTASKPIRCMIAGYYDDNALFASSNTQQRFQPMEEIETSLNATISCDNAIAAWMEADSEIELTVNDKPYKGKHIHIPISSSLLRLQSRQDARAKLTLFRV